MKKSALFISALCFYGCAAMQAPRIYQLAIMDESTDGNDSYLLIFENGTQISANKSINGEVNCWFKKELDSYRKIRENISISHKWFDNLQALHNEASKNSVEVQNKQPSNYSFFKYLCCCLSRTDEK